MLILFRKLRKLKLNLKICFQYHIEKMTTDVEIQVYEKSLTELDNAKIKILLDNNSPEMLALQLFYYKELENDGFVYRREYPEDSYTLISLIHMACRPKYTTEQVTVLLDIKFKSCQKYQFRRRCKVNVHTHILHLAKNLSTRYAKEYHRCCPRVKSLISTEEMLRCKTGKQNFYPAKYLVFVKEYIANNPINQWHRESEYTLNFDEPEVGLDKYICKKCSTVLKKKSRLRHYRSCNKV